jgi:hypothetical protein
MAAWRDASSLNLLLTGILKEFFFLFTETDAREMHIRL